MTSRERVLAAIGGGDVDRQAVLAWPFDNQASDIRCFNDQTLPAKIESGGAPVALVEVTNPFGLALQRDINLSQILKDDPREGNEILANLVAESRRQIELAFEVGADGILYQLFGARSSHCTPMQYGGFYLERDREILESAGGLANLVFVVGEDDVYLDFVSDLPAQLFGWDAKGSGIPASDVRQLRDGALVSEDPASDVLLVPGTASLSRILETSVRTENSYAL